MRKEGRTRLGLAGPFGVSYSRVIFGWNLGGNKMDPKGFGFTGNGRALWEAKGKGNDHHVMAQKSIPPIITQSVSLYFFTSHICQSILGLISYTFPDLFCTRVLKKYVDLSVLEKRTKSYRFLAPEDRLDLDLLEENKLRVKLC